MAFLHPSPYATWKFADVSIFPFSLFLRLLISARGLKAPRCAPVVATLLRACQPLARSGRGRGWWGVDGVGVGVLELVTFWPTKKTSFFQRSKNPICSLGTIPT